MSFTLQPTRKAVAIAAVAFATSLAAEGAVSAPAPSADPVQVASTTGPATPSATTR